jgi:hypothetical protein
VSVLREPKGDDVTNLPKWARPALLATALVNFVAAAGFLPPAHALRAAAGLPDDGHPLYLLTVSLFVGLFGFAYLRWSQTGRVDRLFLAIAAIGKLSFFSLVLGFWIAGALPFRAPLAGAWDLVFGIMFLMWLRRT